MFPVAVDTEYIGREPLSVFVKLVKISWVLTRFSLDTKLLILSDWFANKTPVFFHRNVVIIIINNRYCNNFQFKNKLQMYIHYEFIMM